MFDLNLNFSTRFLLLLFSLGPTCSNSVSQTKKPSNKTILKHQSPPWWKKENGYPVINGKPKFLVGINYISAEFGHSPKLWEDKAADIILNRDFKEMKRLGIDAIRIQAAKFHMPKTFETILRYARKYNILVMPNLQLSDLTRGSLDSWFMGQGSGRVDLPEPAHQGRFMNERPDPFVDPLLSKEKNFIHSILARYRTEKFIFAWDICNEPNWALYFGNPGKYLQYLGKNTSLARKVTGEWAKQLCQTAKKADPNHPITLGIDHGVPLMDVGFDWRTVAGAVDLMTTHGYSRNVTGYMRIGGACSLRDSYVLPFVTALSRMNGKPMASGECGNNSYVMSEQKQGDFYRVMLFSQLVNGAVGIFPWCFHAFDLRKPRIRKMYDGGPAETEFGIVSPDHLEKPAAVELGKFSRALAKIDFSVFHPPAPNCAIFSPLSYYDFLEEHRGSLFNAFVLAKRAHIQVDIASIDKDLSKYKLLILPTTHLTISEMEKVKKFVLGGGSLWCSVTDALGGRASYMADILGWKVEDYIVAPSEIVLEFKHSFGKIKKGETFKYKCDTWGYFAADPKPENKRQYQTIVAPTTARVLATDSSGRPDLLLNKAGKGAVLSTTFGLEYFLSQMPDPYILDRTHELYKEMARRAGIDSIATCNSPYVEIGRLDGNRSHLLFLINHDYKAHEATLVFRNIPSSLEDFLGGKPVKVGKTNHLNLFFPKSGVKAFLFDK